jgi:DNA-binding transcriptional MerR regulator
MRHYQPSERADAVALAATVGPKRAAEQLGIPPRTVAYWTHQPAASPIIAAAEASIAERLETAASIALEAVTEGLRDPKARLGDRARALEVLATQANLATGRATMRSENVNVNVNVTEYEAMLDAMDPVTYRAMLAELAAYNAENPVDHVIEALRRLTDEQRAELETRIAEAERPLAWQGTGIYGELVEFPGSEMYYTADDPRWETGALVRRFDPRRGPSGRLTDGQ